VISGAEQRIQEIAYNLSEYFTRHFKDEHTRNSTRFNTATPRSNMPSATQTERRWQSTSIRIRMSASKPP
jgi:sigma54-dependent transcription regulator